MKTEYFRNDISTSQRKIEIAAVLLTAAGKFIFMDFLEWKLPFILVSICLWVAYIVGQNKRRPGILYYWGFRTDNFRRAVVLVLPYGIIAVVLFFIVGYYRDTLNLSWHILPVLVLYPHYWLILGTFVLALFYGFVYLKYRNLYVMGLFHGWLGALFFYTVIGRDPLAEVFGKFF